MCINRCSPFGSRHGIGHTPPGTAATAPLRKLQPLLQRCPFIPATRRIRRTGGIPGMKFINLLVFQSSWLKVWHTILIKNILILILKYYYCYHCLRWSLLLVLYNFIIFLSPWFSWDWLLLVITLNKSEQETMCLLNSVFASPLEIDNYRRGVLFLPFCLCFHEQIYTDVLTLSLQLILLVVVL